MKITVDIADAKVSPDENAVITTHSLGSCIGVTLYDPQVRLGGMLHFQLPTATLDAERARQNPLMFADTGFSQLLEAMLAKGAQKSRLKVHMAGAAQMLKDAAIFDIGRRNHAAMRKILWQHKMFISAEHIGGSQPRTMHLAIRDGAVTLKMGQETICLSQGKQS